MPSSNSWWLKHRLWSFIIQPHHRRNPSEEGIMHPLTSSQCSEVSPLDWPYLDSQSSRCHWKPRSLQQKLLNKEMCHCPGSLMNGAGTATTPISIFVHATNRFATPGQAGPSEAFAPVSRFQCWVNPIFTALAERASSADCIKGAVRSTSQYWQRRLKSVNIAVWIQTKKWLD